MTYKDKVVQAIVSIIPTVVYGDITEEQRNLLIDRISNLLDFQTAVSLVREQLRTDPELYEVYKANIAMDFYDEYRRHREEVKSTYVNNEDIHKIANTAAKNFLTRWSN